MARLTDGKSGTIARAERPAKGQRLIFDEHRDAPRGFALRVTSAGGKAFILRYRFDGRERRKTIGEWGVWTLEAARAEARELMRRIQQGDDPLEEKRKRKMEPTVSELASEWLEKHAAGLASEGAIRGYVNNDVLPAIGRLKVRDVRRRDVIELVENKAEKTPRAAAQVLLYARLLLDYAADRDLIPANPAAGLKPSSIQVKGRRDPLKQTARLRVLDTTEIQALWANAETCGMHKLTALALKLILVTGQRPGEIAGMTAEEIDGRWWTIPAERRGKTETAHTVYLTDTALQLIDEARDEVKRLQRRRGAPASSFIFETGAGGSLTVPAMWRAVKRAYDALGGKQVSPWGDWSPHDLRRTMRTGLSACKVRPDIAELTVGHTKKGIEAVYDQHEFNEERLSALEAWERRLLAITQGQNPDKQFANVVRLEA